MTIIIDADTVILETACTGAQAEAFLLERGAQIKNAIESSIAEYVGDIFPDWLCMHREEQREEWAQHKLDIARGK